MYFDFKMILEIMANVVGANYAMSQTDGSMAMRTVAAFGGSLVGEIAASFLFLGGGTTYMPGKTYLTFPIISALTVLFNSQLNLIGNDAIAIAFVQLIFAAGYGSVGYFGSRTGYQKIPVAAVLPSMES